MNNNSNNKSDTLAGFSALIVVAAIALTSCTTFVTKEYEPEYLLLEQEERNRRAEPGYLDFNGWQVDLNCRSTFESLDDEEIESDLYSVFVSPSWSEGQTTELWSERPTTEEPPDQEIYIPDVRVTLLPQESDTLLPLDSLEYQKSNKELLFFGDLHLPPQVDSIHVVYAVYLRSDVGSLIDSTTFSYILHRYIKKKRVPPGFAGE